MVMPARVTTRDATRTRATHPAITSTTFDIRLYFAGVTAQQAIDGLAFDSLESVESYQRDNPNIRVFSVRALDRPPRNDRGAGMSRVEVEP